MSQLLLPFPDKRDRVDGQSTTRSLACSIYGHGYCDRKWCACACHPLTPLQELARLSNKARVERFNLHHVSLVDDDGCIEQ